MKTALIGYVNQIGTKISLLTRTQKLQAVQGVQTLIIYVQLATRRFIPSDQSAEIVSVANQLIAALLS